MIISNEVDGQEVRLDVPSICVLLLAETPSGSSFLVRRLEKQGCKCTLTTSAEDAIQALGERPFDIVLSMLPLQNGELSHLISLLEGSSTSLFYSHPADDTYWWLLALYRGEQCLLAPAFRQAEFASLLDEVVQEIYWDRAAAAENFAGGFAAPKRILGSPGGITARRRQTEPPRPAIAAASADPLADSSTKIPRVS